LLALLLIVIYLTANKIIIRKCIFLSLLPIFCLSSFLSVFLPFRRCNRQISLGHRSTLIVSLSTLQNNCGLQWARSRVKPKVVYVAISFGQLTGSEALHWHDKQCHHAMYWRDVMIACSYGNALFFVTVNELGTERLSQN
jgi:hypothetical protein